MGQVNPNSELMNCLGCGRDTIRKGGYCAKCLPANLMQTGAPQHIDDRKDRHIRKESETFRMDTDGFYEDFEYEKDMER